MSFDSAKQPLKHSCLLPTSTDSSARTTQVTYGGYVTLQPARTSRPELPNRGIMIRKAIPTNWGTQRRCNPRQPDNHLEIFSTIRGFFSRSRTIVDVPSCEFCQLLAFLVLTRRQQVEAKALSLFGTGGILGALAADTSTMVPQFFGLKISDHILIMQDIGIGRGLTLARLLRRSLYSQYYRRKVREVFKKLGKSIGGFFGHLNAPSTVTQLLDHNLGEFKNDDAKDRIFSLKILPMKRYIEFDEVEDGEIHGIIEDEFFDEIKQLQTPVFALGNISPDNILVSLDGPNIGFIGWQYSRPGCGLNEDIAQLVAHVQAHVLLVNDAKRVVADDWIGPIEVVNDENELPVEIDELLS